MTSHTGCVCLFRTARRAWTLQMRPRQRGSVQPWRDRSIQQAPGLERNTHTSDYIYIIINSLSFRQASPLLFLTLPCLLFPHLSVFHSISPIIFYMLLSFAEPPIFFSLPLSQTELVGRWTILAVWTCPQAVSVNRNRADLRSALHLHMRQSEKYSTSAHWAQTDSDNSLLEIFYDAALEWSKRQMADLIFSLLHRQESQVRVDPEQGLSVSTNLTPLLF